MGSCNILIRKARKDYVCEVCGHKINKGDEYLDKVYLRKEYTIHYRYHDECPRKAPVEQVADLLIKHDFKVPVIYGNQKYWLVGLVNNQLVLQFDDTVNWIPVSEFKELTIVD